MSPEKRFVEPCVPLVAPATTPTIADEDKRPCRPHTGPNGAHGVESSNGAVRRNDERLLRIEERLWEGHPKDWKVPRLDHIAHVSRVPRPKSGPATKHLHPAGRLPSVCGG